MTPSAIVKNCMKAGPRVVRKMPGRKQITSGKTSFTGSAWARIIARSRRRLRRSSAWWRSTVEKPAPTCSAWTRAEQKIDIVEIGFREKSIVTTEQRDGKGNRMLDPVSGEPMMAPDSGGIAFPSKDGFTIHMDFTAVWGIMPEQAPEMIRLTGNLQKVEDLAKWERDLISAMKYRGNFLADPTLSQPK